MLTCNSAAQRPNLTGYPLADSKYIAGYIGGVIMKDPPPLPNPPSLFPFKVFIKLALFCKPKRSSILLNKAKTRERVIELCRKPFVTVGVDTITPSDKERILA